MRVLYHRLYIKLAVLALLLALGHPASAQDVAAVPVQQITLMQYVMQERPVLAELVTKSGLTPTLSGDAPYTILAPPEAALNSIKGLPPVRIRAILSGHILEGMYQEIDFKDGATLKTLAHTNITVCRKKDHTLIDGMRISSSTEVKNGVVHSLSGKLNL